jgi:hypothetical protein
MSGTVSPGFGIIVKMFVIFLVFLGILYSGVIIKLITDYHRTVTWRITFGLITPVLVLSSLIISHLTGNKVFNIITIFLLTYMNLIYLLLPVNTYFAMLVYTGNNRMITTLLVGLISILTTSLILCGLITIIYLILKQLE